MIIKTKFNNGRRLIPLSGRICREKRAWQSVSHERLRKLMHESCESSEGCMIQYNCAREIVVVKSSLIIINLVMNLPSKQSIYFICSFFTTFQNWIFKSKIWWHFRFSTNRFRILRHLTFYSFWNTVQIWIFNYLFSTFFCLFYAIWISILVKIIFDYSV